MLEEMCSFITALASWHSTTEISRATGLSLPAVSRATTRGRFCLDVSVGYRNFKLFRLLPREELRFCWLAWPQVMSRLQPDVLRWEEPLASRLHGSTLAWQRKVHGGLYVLLPRQETTADVVCAVARAVREDLEREDLKRLRTPAPQEA
jgi:hypothetical protein